MAVYSKVAVYKCKVVVYKCKLVDYSKVAVYKCKLADYSKAVQFTSVNQQFTLVKYLIPGLQLFFS